MYQRPLFVDILNKKIEDAIEFMRRYEPPEGYFLSFSGGKDSVVLYDLAIKAGVKFKAYYSYTTIDPPELVKFIKQNYPDVIRKRPEKSFFKLIQKFDYPAIHRRWCSYQLKIRPVRVTVVPLRHRLVGIRKEESYKRALRPRVSYIKSYRLYHYKPIFDWTESEVWEYIKREKLPYCSLYDEGFDRIGCVICPFLSQKKLEIHKSKWKGIYRAFEKAMYRLYKSKIEPKKHTFKHPEYYENFNIFLKNWYERNYIF